MGTSRGMEGREGDEGGCSDDNKMMSIFLIRSEKGKVRCWDEFGLRGHF